MQYYADLCLKCQSCKNPLTKIERGDIIIKLSNERERERKRTKTFLKKGLTSSKESDII